MCKIILNTTILLLATLAASSTYARIFSTKLRPATGLLYFIFPSKFVWFWGWFIVHLFDKLICKNCLCNILHAIQDSNQAAIVVFGEAGSTSGQLCREKYSAPPILCVYGIS